MTLIKSILLGSAAGIVAVASAQAADLPTEEGGSRRAIRQDLQRRRHHRLDPAGLRHLREALGLHHRAVRGREPVQPVQLAGSTIIQALRRSIRMAAAAHLIRPCRGSGPRHGAPALPTVTITERRWPRDVAFRASGVLTSLGQHCLPNQNNAIFNRNATGWYDPRQLRLRHRLEHRLRPVDRSFRHQRRTWATASTPSPASAPISTPPI